MARSSVVKRASAKTEQFGMFKFRSTYQDADAHLEELEGATEVRN